MRAEDLDLKELLESDSEGGLVRFAGMRALIFDAAAQGLLRKELIETFGVPVARGLLARCGYAHGQRMAKATRAQFTWDSEDDWRRAGSKIYELQGLFMLQPGSGLPTDPEGATWSLSYEAAQHLLHVGKADIPVCWTLCGLFSGYHSVVFGKEMLAIEDRCIAQGDTACHLVVKSVLDWGDLSKGPSFDFTRINRDLSLIETREGIQGTPSEPSARTRRRVTGAPVEGDPGDIIARSPTMQRVMTLALTIAKVDSTVLITGESGTGKERVARFMHDHSSCAEGPFVGVNCGAISEHLLESELFGHARGSFTGATTDRPGLFEAANGGTLFLDEVGEIPPAMQVKLLRALQEREVRRVGENTSRPFHARILTATNRALGPEVAEKRFRQDLYYRLKVVELMIPPLRERRKDLLPLARVLLREASDRMKRPIEGFSVPVADCLLGYAWPGNVRELANVMERAVAVATRNRVELEDLPPEVRLTPPFLLSPHLVIRPLEAIEEDYILTILEAKGGNRKLASAALGIGAATLQRKLKLYHTRDLSNSPSARVKRSPPRRRFSDTAT